jgi:hypothetical protein
MDIHELFRPPTKEERGITIRVTEEEYARIRSSKESMTTDEWIKSLGKLCPTR